MCLVGCGALGTVIANVLVRAGVGYLRIVDRDYVELSNLQRQVLFDERDVEAGTPKSVAAATKLSAVNSEVSIEPIVEDFAPDNAERYIRDVDLVMDGSDNLETRYLLNDGCVKLDRPWVYAAALASYGVMMPIVPGDTACLRCIYVQSPAAGSVDTCDTAGILGPVPGLIGNFAAAEALKLLIGARDKLSRGLLWLDVWHNTFERTPLGGPVADCPTCQERRFEFLSAEIASRAAVLCGRDAVHVRPVHGVLDLAVVAARLAAVADVRATEHLLQCRVEGYNLTVFRDGRAIVKGTSDLSVARSVYARYVGM